MTNSNPTKRAGLAAGAALLAGTLLAQMPPPPPPPPPPLPDGVSAPLSPAPLPPPLAIPEGLTPENRDPFWPVGYRPKSREEIERERTQIAQARQIVNPPLWEEAQAALRIGGSMRTPQGFTALINGELVKTGDIVSLQFKNQQYRWKIDSIALSGIALSRFDITPLEQPPPTSGKDRP